MFMDRVEPYAAVHETVEAARQLGLAWATEVVNAVLREALRRRNQILLWFRRKPPTIRFSHPLELLERWEKEYGQRSAHRLCEWNNRPAEVCIRLRPTAPPLDDYRARLRAAGIEAHPHPFAPARFLILPHGVAPVDLPGYAEGWFYVQDPATIVAAELLAPQPGERILDACAAPGGKTVLLYDMLGDGAHLVAADHRSDRLERLRANLQRLGAKGVEIIELDLTAPPDADPGRGAGELPAFDAILLDVPCTNTGVIRRRPDVRWSFNWARLEAAVRTQAAILDGAVQRLRPGGRLVYSTCSLEPEEDEELIRSWIARHPGWKAARARKLFPPDTQTDGAYVALLRRTDSDEDTPRA